jgi:hypothetical protein
MYILLFFLFIIFKYGDTALINASEQGHCEIVKLLIENNADVNIQNNVFFLFFFHFKLYIFFCIVYY